MSEGTVSPGEPLVVEATETKPGFAGTSVPRKEDRRLVQGQGVFFDDVKRHGMGFVHFVRSPYAHAKIVSIDVSAALEVEGVYGTLTGDEVAILTDPFFEMSIAPGQRDPGLRARRREGAVRGRARGRRRRDDARPRTRRSRAGRGRVRAARAARRRAAGEGRRCSHPPRRGRVERRLGGRLRLGRLGGRGGRVGPRRPYLRAALRSLLVHPARVLGLPRRVQPRHRAVDDALQPPDAGDRRDLDGARAARRHRQAALRHPGHRGRVRQQDLPAPVLRRLLPARTQAEPAGAMDGVAHRPAHGQRARKRALVPGCRGRGLRPTGRCSASAARRSTTAAPSPATSRSAASSGRRSRPAATAGRTCASTSRRSARTSRRCHRTAAIRGCSTSG